MTSLRPRQASGRVVLLVMLAVALALLVTMSWLGRRLRDQTHLRTETPQRDGGGY